MRKNLLLLLLLLIQFLFSYSQNPNFYIKQQRSFGGSKTDYLTSFDKTGDNGFIFSAYTYSADGDISGFHGMEDGWIVKLNNTGDIQWQKCFGGSQIDEAYDVKATSDGGYIITGSTSSTDGDMTGIINKGSSDIWVAKTDATGNIQWLRTYGGSDMDNSIFIQQTKNGDFILVGNTYSGNGDVSGNHGADDCWVVRLNAQGTILWQKCIGSNIWDEASDALLTADEYLVVAGRFGGGSAWTFKMDPSGNILWDNTYDGYKAFSISAAAEDNFIITSYTYSNEGSCHGESSLGFADAEFILINHNGDVLGHECFSSDLDDAGLNAMQTDEGNYIGCGYYHYDYDFDEGIIKSYSDLFVVAFSAFGKQKRYQLFGGSKSDQGFEMIRQNNELIIAGVTDSNDGDVAFNHGGRDIWIIRLDKQDTLMQTFSKQQTTQTTSPLLQLQLYPNPATSFITIKTSRLGTLQITDINGHLIQTQTIHDLQTIVPVNNLRAGIYMVKVISDKNVLRGRFIKQ